ncbi:hypothetical protein BA895_11460 [Humibacillus sp. DSM 29435]|uniref:class F sortase n=1 Tax=Humibacillus sp. DSM 29435 TaxID=1869167 RepID=UPI0008724E22|nr:class F sortase [Humibacillus sp. DSM 29435]OFE14225.1 hypothetical protein BA895_11460 [Humibacillus sp. DSM 29435]
MNIRYRSAAWVGLVIVLVTAAMVFLIARPIDRPNAASADQRRAATSSNATVKAVPPPAATSKPAQTTTQKPRPSATQVSGAAGQPSKAVSSASPREAAARCVSGIPDRLVIPSLGVDAPFQTIGLDTSAPADAQGRQRLGSPSDRTKAGWYAAGPRPGSGRGSVLTNGHTYRDGSAIFKESFSSHVAVGQRIDIRQRAGGVCSYRINRVWAEVNAATDYPRIVASHHLYDFGGPERLFLTTCSGSFNSATQNYNQITIVTALPIARG